MVLMILFVMSVVWKSKVVILKKLIYRLYSHVGRKSVQNRDKFIKETLSNLDSGLRILDAGAGECKYKKFCNHLNYVSQDFCEYDGTLPILFLYITF